MLLEKNNGLINGLFHVTFDLVVGNIPSRRPTMHHIRKFHNLKLIAQNFSGKATWLGVWVIVTCHRKW